MNSVTFDVSADGQRFLMLKDVIDASGTAKQPTAVLVQNWFEEFRNKK